MQLQSGTLLKRGEYRIINSIGSGGFGITYLAEQVNLHRKVCIKEFFPQDYYKRDEDSVSISLLSESFKENMLRFKAKFIKEAQTIATLNHANIIPIYDVFEENGTAYYVMDYVDGESLSARVKSVGTLSERDAVGYIKQVAAALEHIHEQQIMHLDVKPGNIMVRTKGDHAILIDFGLSKHYDSESGEATSTTPVGVSHGFAPMEQYQVGGVSTFSPETDIYSLGATLYYLVTGNVPPQATVVAEQGLPQLGALSSNIREAIERSMSYLRKDRPHTIKEFLALLDNVEPVVEVLVADDERTNIAPQTPTQKQDDKKPKPKKNHWWVWTLLLLFIVVLLMSIKDLFSNVDNSKEVATKEKTIYMPTNVTAPEELEIEAPADELGVVCPVEDASEVVKQEGPTKQGVPTSESTEIYTTYNVGDYYNENGKLGVVFEVRDGGRHGKIVSLDQTEAPWDSRVAWNDNKWSYINGTKTGTSSKSDGKDNTDKIMSRSDSENFKPFVWCREKGEDWYLPAKEELKAIYNNKSAINSTLTKYGDTKLSDDWHWSSTEYVESAEFVAWGVTMYDGNTDDYCKYFGSYVRAVSTF